MNGPPTVRVGADYTCETLCSPLLSVVSNALADTGLRAGIYFLGLGVECRSSATDGPNAQDIGRGRHLDLDAEPFGIKLQQRVMTLVG